MSDTATRPASSVPVKERFLGVDVARGVALFAMLAANIWDAAVGAVDAAGQPTLAGMTVFGRSATLFVTVAGISLAFISGGRHPRRQGRDRRATVVGLIVRALLIAAIGLALGYAASDNLVVILPFYGLFFLLAIPFIGLRPRTLALIAAGVALVGPLLPLAATSLDLEPVNVGSPTFTDLFTNPGGFVLQLFVTGYFPAVVYMAYIFVGMAIGRLDLSSTRVAARLLVSGLVLAVVGSARPPALAGYVNAPTAFAGTERPVRTSVVQLAGCCGACARWPLRFTVLARSTRSISAPRSLIARTLIVAVPPGAAGVTWTARKA
jgi:uncharacterized membrane protein